MTDCTHEPCAEPVWWSTVNASEAFPGVMTPLTWSWTGPALEGFSRDGLHAIGCMSASERPIPERVGLKATSIAYGRAVVNVNTLHKFTNRMPGANADDFDRKFLAGEHFDFPPERTWTRYPYVAVKFPRAAWRSRSLSKLGEDTQRWWANCLASPPSDRAEALDRLTDASDNRMRLIGTQHWVATLTMFAFHASVEKLLNEVAMPELANILLTTDGTEENRSLIDLWRVSRNDLPLSQFLLTHGFHGAAQELSDHSWREDQRLLDSLVKSYQGMPDTASPSELERERLERRNEAERQFLSALNHPKRELASFLLKHGRQYTALRQLGRNTILRIVDVARHSARTIGSQLAPDVLENQDDVFYLTVPELTTLPSNYRDLVEHRRKLRHEYLQQELPDRWLGEAKPITLAAPEQRTALAGIGVSSGIVEARARVVLDPYEDTLEQGEILVCNTTDPSWAALFFVASAVVINIGGPLSHGAVVARELSIPGVVNVRDATRIIKTGDLLRVDGTTGSVEILG